MIHISLPGMCLGLHPCILGPQYVGQGQYGTKNVPISAHMYKNVSFSRNMFPTKNKVLCLQCNDDKCEH